MSEFIWVIVETPFSTLYVAVILPPTVAFVVSTLPKIKKSTIYDVLFDVEISNAVVTVLFVVVTILDAYCITPLDHCATVVLVAVKTYRAWGAPETSIEFVAVPILFALILFIVSVKVLLVKVSVVCLPTSVSVSVGKVNVPVFEIVLIIGAVKVFVS